MADPYAGPSSSTSVRLAASHEVRVDFWRTVDAFRREELFCDVRLYPQGADGAEDDGPAEGVPCHALVLASLSDALCEAMAQSPLDGQLALFLVGVGRDCVQRFVEAAYGYLAGRTQTSPFELPEELAGVSEALMVDCVRLESAPVKIKTELEPAGFADEEDAQGNYEDEEDADYVGWQEELEEAEEESSESEDDASDSDADYQVPLPKKRKAGSRTAPKLKKESAARNQDGARRRGRPRKKPQDEERLRVKKELPPLPPADDIYAQMVSGHGTLDVVVQKVPLDNAKLCKVLAARTVKYMSLVGLKKTSPPDGQNEAVVEALPLAWTPPDEMQTEGDRYSQYSNYCRALKSVLGLSEIEAHYQPYVLTCMGMSEVVNPGASTRVFAKRRHCDKSEAELREQLAKEDPDGLSSPGEAKPFFSMDRGEAQINLSLTLSIEELDGVALLAFSVKGRVDAMCLGFMHGKDRAKDTHYFLKALCDVWSLRRSDGMVDKSESIAKIFSDLRPRAEVCNVLHSFLSSGAKEAYASSFQSDRQCPSCGRLFEIRNEKEYRRYQYHCKTHQYKDYACDCPGLKFETARAKMAHVQLVHKTGFSKCPLCPHVSKTKFLLGHIEKSHGANAECPHCSRVMVSAQELLSHVEEEHPEEVKRTYAEDTRKVFGGRKPYKRGPRPENPSACDQCGKVYKNSSSLYKHMYSHNRFVCKLCGFSTTELARYRDHMRLDHHKPLHWQPNARRYLW